MISPNKMTRDQIIEELFPDAEDVVRDALKAIKTGVLRDIMRKRRVTGEKS